MRIPVRFQISRQSATITLFDGFQKRDVQPRMVHQRARGVRARNGPGTQFRKLLHGIYRDIAGAGDQAGFTGYRLTAFSEHILGKVNTTVPGGLLAAQRSAPAR